MGDPDIQHNIKVKERSGKQVINVRYRNEEKEFVSLVYANVH
jgi:hypothetical protein